MSVDDLKAILSILTCPGNRMDLTKFQGVNAEHDELFIDGNPPKNLDHGDHELLKNLNCRWDKNYNCWRVGT